MLTTQDLTLAYDADPVVSELNLTVPEGQITTFIGPNGCGKSTILRSLVRLHRPRAGVILLDGHDLHHRPTREVARRLGFLSQHAEVPDGLSVVDLVRRGRFPHRGAWEPFGPDDEAAVSRALELCHLGELAHRPLDELSGGQRQRAWIALTLAQETPLVLLDEPTTFLDPQNQAEVLDLVVRLNRDHGRTFVLVLHDLAQARRISHHVVALKAGRVEAEGRPEEILVPSLLESLFGVPFDERGPVPAVPLGQPPFPVPRGERVPSIEASALSGGYHGRAVFGPLNLSLGPGGFIAIVGANGSGKSTLLRTLAGLQKPLGGHVRLEDRPVAGERPRVLARRRSFVRQDTPLPAGFTVQELLDLGQYHRRGLWGRRKELPDLRAALEALGLEALVHRKLEHLSGGQRQRVWLALALVQGSPVLLLDEPTSFLDPRHQRDLMDALWRLTRTSATTVVAVLHEVDLAQRYADRVVSMDELAAPLTDAAPTRPTNWEPRGVRTRLVWHRVLSAFYRLRAAGHLPSVQTYPGALANRNRTMLATLARPMDQYTLVERRRLDPESDHATWNLVFEGCGRPDLAPGDMAYLNWRNPPEVVRQVLERYGEKGDRTVLTTVSSSGYLPARLETLSLEQALSRRIDLHETSPRLLRRVGLSDFVEHNRRQDQRHRQFHREASKDGALLLTHPHFDYRKVLLPRMLPDLHAAGVSLAELVRAQERISARPYTLAGFRQEGDRFRFEITVSQVDKRIFVNGNDTELASARGSQFFHSLAIGDTVEGWLLPEVHRYPVTMGRQVPLVVITTGSGVSSLLSLLRSDEALGPVWAVYGVRSFATKHLYGPELQAHLDSGRLARLDVANSRPQAGEGEPRRVQAVLWEQRRDVAEQIRQGAHFYLCGRLSMGTEVAQTLERILVDQGLASTPAEARSTLVDWHHNLRFQASVSGA